MEKTLQIKQMFKGHAASQYFGAEGTYQTSVAVDPDLPIVSTDIRTSGFAVPVGYAKFSGSNVTAAVLRVINNPKNTLTYVVLTNGRLISYDSSLGSETLIGTVTGGVATWADYHNNYIYIFTGTDVSRYGPLNNSPALTNTVWTGATLGSQTALTNTTYPTLRGVSMPNHAGHSHGDGSYYFCDFKNGQGFVHKISTRKVTDEGDTNGNTIPSLYNALDLPWGFYPTGIESSGTNLIIIGIYTTDTIVNQGKAAFVLWDPTNTVSFFLGPVPLPDPLATAVLNVNGIIHIWTGNAQNGVRLSTYQTGQTVQPKCYQEEGLPPLAGAVDALGSRVVWGGFSTNPSTGAVVWAYGSKDPRLPSGLHCIAKASSSGTSPLTTALKYVQQDSNITPKVVIAWTDGTGSGLDKYSATATLASILRFVINIGQKFEFKSIKVPLAGAVNSTTAIQPKIYFDDLSSNTSTSIPAINNTNYSGKRKVMYKAADLKDTLAYNNAVLEFAWTNTNPLTIGFPITVVLDTKEDE